MKGGNIVTEKMGQRSDQLLQWILYHRVYIYSGSNLHDHVDGW
jgi:hypothetical protein